MKLSVVISAYNNQDTIKDCIKSINFADEVIVVDNQSTDDTAKIAKENGAKVFSRPNNPRKLNDSKNFGFSKASHEWILSLDTDERVDLDLKDQIQSILSQDIALQPDGFLIPRKNIIFGRWIQRGLWYPDHQLRLFKASKGKFPNIHNHELLQVEGTTQTLSGHITHYNYNTVSQYLQKIDRQYSDNEVDTFLKNHGQIHWYDAIRFPAQDFLANYFAREGYKDGLHGLVLSLLQAFYMFVVFAKIWERQGFKPQDVDLKDSQKEFNRVIYQLRYWFLHSRNSKAPIHQKIWLKLQSMF